MSTTSHTTKDIFTVWRQSAEKYFANVDKIAAEYRKAVSDLQNEYFDAWKNVTLTTISAQQQFAKQDWF